MASVGVTASSPVIINTTSAAAPCAPHHLLPSPSSPVRSLTTCPPPPLQMFHSITGSLDIINTTNATNVLIQGDARDLG